MIMREVKSDKEKSNDQVHPYKASPGDLLPPIELHFQIAQAAINDQRVMILMKLYQ